MPRGESPRARNNGEKKIDCPRSFLKKNRIQFLIETKLRAESARTTAKMDKKNTVIGVLLLMAAMYFMYDSSVKEAAAERSARAARAERMATPSETAKAVPARKAPKQSPFAPDENIPEKIVSLENDKIRINFTNKGGAIKNVELRDYPKAQGSKDPFVFNDIDARVPAMGLSFFNPDEGEIPVPIQKSFALVDSSADSVTYRLRVENKFDITRKYQLVKADGIDAAPYTIATATSVKNISSEPQPIGEVFICLGAVPPTESDVYGTNLAAAFFDGDGSRFLKSSSFVDSSGFLGIGKTRAKYFEKLSLYPIVWGAVKNQFFAAVFTPEKIASNGGDAIPIAINLKDSNKYMRNAVAGFMGFEAETLQPGEVWNLGGSYYVGPKELDRLYSLGAGQEDVMNYGWFGFVSRPLSRLMNWIHSWVSAVSPNWGWGWSIVILTIIVRAVIWPLTSVQIKSAQRMAKLQEPLKAIREKYKDDQKRVQQETMKLYSEYGINPLAGCLPIFIQLPIFIGLYYMLQTSCEIRFAHFLWIKDLARPDTIEALPSVFGIPLHLLPLINAAVTFLQMHITPTPSTDKTQAWIFKLMPVIMLVFFYTFPSGLVLYWTVQSLIGILQAIIVRRGASKVVLKKRDKPGFMQRMQEAMEQAQAAQMARGPEFEKLPLKERLRIAREDAAKARKKLKDERLKGTLYEPRKKNPGGRSTPPKR
ncbi:MAG: hypothetical protein BHW65_00930 [Verrucomicrobia bacterium CAG:312_58_20]|nr:MAG: hypothetical protein BHW65_00930 [Verrucomicrobia bacterium CAG:312_58_20]